MICNKKLKRISTNLELYKAIEPLLGKKRIRQDIRGIWRDGCYKRLSVLKQGGKYDYIDVRIVSRSDANKSLGKSLKEKLNLAVVLAEDAEVLNYQRLRKLKQVPTPVMPQVHEYTKPTKTTYTATELLESLTHINANLAEYSEGETVVSDQLYIHVKSTGIQAHWTTRSERGYNCSQYFEYKPTASLKRFLKESNFCGGSLDKLIVLLHAYNCYEGLKAMFH